MGRTPSELIADLFKAGASEEYPKLLDAVSRKNESFDNRGVERAVRSQVITQMVVDSYEAVLVYVVGQLEISAEAIGIRTQDDTEAFLTNLDSEAETVRKRFELKRDRMLTKAGANRSSGDDYERKTSNLKETAKATIKLHVIATLNPEAKAREETWKRLHQVVDGQIASKAHEIEEQARTRVHALGKRIPPPREAYDSKHIAGMWMKAMKERIELIFTLYPQIVKQLRIDVDGLHSIIRAHVNSLVDEAVTGYRRIVTKEFDEWGHEVPQEVVEKAVAAARASIVSQTELMLVDLEKPVTLNEQQRMTHGQEVRGLVLKNIEVPKRDPAPNPPPAPETPPPMSGIHKAMLSGVEEQREREVLERRVREAEAALQTPPTGRLGLPKKPEPKPWPAWKLALIPIAAAIVISPIGYLYSTSESRAFAARTKVSDSYSPILQQLATVTHPVAPLATYPVPDTGRVLAVFKQLDSAYVSVHAQLRARFSQASQSQYDSLRTETIGLMGLIDKLRFVSALKPSDDAKEQALRLALFDDYLAQCQRVSVRATNLQYSIVAESNR